VPSGGGWELAHYDAAGGSYSHEPGLEVSGSYSYDEDRNGVADGWTVYYDAVSGVKAGATVYIEANCIPGTAVPYATSQAKTAATAKTAAGAGVPPVAAGTGPVTRGPSGHATEAPRP
jgi:hypothetical protein